MKASYEVAKGLLDPLILKQLKQQPQSAYQMQHTLNEALGVLFSPSILYSRIRKLERDGAINHHEKAFVITEHGKETLKQHLETLQKIFEYLQEVMLKMAGT